MELIPWSLDSFRERISVKQPLKLEMLVEFFYRQIHSSRTIRNMKPFIWFVCGLPLWGLQRQSSTLLISPPTLSPMMKTFDVEIYLKVLGKAAWAKRKKILFSPMSKKSDSARRPLGQMSRPFNYWPLIDVTNRRRRKNFSNSPSVRSSVRLSSTFCLLTYEVNWRHRER